MNSQFKTVAESSEVATEDVADLGHESTGGQNRPSAETRQIIGERKLTIPEAAKVMGIGTTSLRRIIADGRLPVLRVLKKTLILESDVEMFLQESRVLVKRAEAGSHRLPPLPSAVANSRHLGVVA